MKLRFMNRPIKQENYDIYMYMYIDDPEDIIKFTPAIITGISSNSVIPDSTQQAKHN